MFSGLFTIYLFYFGQLMSINKTRKLLIKADICIKVDNCDELKDVLDNISPKKDIITHVAEYPAYIFMFSSGEIYVSHEQEHIPEEMGYSVMTYAGFRSWLEGFNEKAYWK